MYLCVFGLLGSAKGFYDSRVLELVLVANDTAMFNMIP